MLLARIILGLLILTVRVSLTLIVIVIVIVVALLLLLASSILWRLTPVEVCISLLLAHIFEGLKKRKKRRKKDKKKGLFF